LVNHATSRTDVAVETKVDPLRKEYQIKKLSADKIYKVKVESESPLGESASSPFIEMKVRRSGMNHLLGVHWFMAG